jgi:hypothetical protein
MHWVQWIGGPAQQRRFGVRGSPAGPGGPSTRSRALSRVLPGPATTMAGPVVHKLAFPVRSVVQASGAAHLQVAAEGAGPDHVQRR